MTLVSFDSVHLALAPTIAEGQWWSLGPPSYVITLTSAWPSAAFGAQLA